jgi:HD-like signal output (HDOD) protein
MTSADVFEQIEKMGELPSLPQTLLTIQKVANDERSCADDLARSILRDQALTMRVLKVVNSALYQRRNQEKIRTVRRAVIVMGFETVRKLALGLSVFDMMSKLSRSPWLAEISRHSLITAGFAQVLAEKSGTVKPEEAFVTALIHDIGKVALLECSPSAMDAVLADQKNGTPSLDAERRHYGITHDRAGRRLAARWQLPVDLQNLIGDHHDIDPMSPPRNLDPALGVIVYANAMSKFSCTPENSEFEYKVLRKAGRTLGIPSSQLEDIYVRINDDLNELADGIGIALGDLQDYGQIVNVHGSCNVAPAKMNPEEIARHTADQLKLYQNIGAKVAEGEAPESILKVILEGAVNILGFERVIYLQVDRLDHQLRPWLWAGINTCDLAEKLTLPLKRSTGALALAVLEHRTFHVPMAASKAYEDLVGEKLLAAARCKGFVVAPVLTPDGVTGVLYADCGPEGDDVVAEQAAELNGLALQAGLVVGSREPEPAA